MRTLKQWYNAWMGNEAVRFFIVSAFFGLHGWSLVRNSQGIVSFDKLAGAFFLLLSLSTFVMGILSVAARFQPKQVNDFRK